MKQVLARTEMTSEGASDIYKPGSYAPEVRQALQDVFTQLTDSIRQTGSQRTPEMMLVHGGTETPCNSPRDVEEVCAELDIQTAEILAAIARYNGDARIILHQQ